MLHLARTFPAAVMVLSLMLMLAGGVAQADAPRVVHAEASPNGDGTYTVTATVRHGDTGWDHYADNFEVLAPDGTLLDRRVLYHPHVDEQPFTRSAGDVVVPPGIKRVIVRAHDKVHGYGKGTVTINLPDR